MRSGSTITGRMLAGMLTSSVTPALRAGLATTSTDWRTRSATLTAFLRSARLPDSIFETSRMSLMMRTSRSQLFSAICSRLAMLRVRHRPGVVEDELHRAANRGQRRAQLVADDRDELVLHAIDFAQPRDVLERDDGAGDVTELVAQRRAAGEDREHAAIGMMNLELLVADGLAAQRARRDPLRPAGSSVPSLAMRLNRLQ